LIFLKHAIFLHMNEKLLRPYEPTETEDRIYKNWEDSGFFNPDICVEKGVVDKNAETFSMVLPPPNVTGQLHVGHAVMLAIEDIMVRFNRMQGKRTLWIPGTDHAAIATQSKVEKILSKDNIRRQDLGREAFLEKVNKFAQESQDIILKQTRKMGASIDWSRLAFTLDETRGKAVFTAFQRMHDIGLIFQKERLVNWDPKGQTVISDDEVVHEERQGKMYTFKYSHDFPFTIATTRPETKLGDTGVAVHPDDTRYQQYIGQEFTCNFAGEEITLKVVADEAVDPEFGTGAVGVTPAHSMTDWEIAERTGLPMKQVINEYAKMMVGMDGVANEKTTVAREAVVAWLKEQDLMVKEEDITQNISTAERTGGVIEPLPKMQWWIDTEKKIKIPHSNLDGIDSEKEYSLKEVMLQVVQSGQIEILPSRFEKVYYHWIENLRPWNISRQIWYGHRIPVWYKNGAYNVSETSPGEGWVQDEDTLDTWFSSGLWTFSTLGWPENTKDFQDFHPTSILETGYDIIFFWVARMILMSTALLGDVPFKTVYLHGLVRDEKGRKISKSLGNNIDPLELIEKYGADALRMALIVGTAPGQDSKLGEDKTKAYKKFANKLWNISRFILENTADFNESTFSTFSQADTKLLATQSELLNEITLEMSEHKFYLVADKLYHYIWHDIADHVLEESKIIFESDTSEDIISRKKFLLETLRFSLKTLHPFMPYITEEIWSMLPQYKEDDTKGLLMVQSWPKV
jgi:valyl-tRNA synthetase